jgi:hypothetical protein
MARCSECNKFTSDDSIDPEVQSEHVGEGSAEVEVRIARACAECGTEKKEYTFSFDFELPQEAVDHECPNPDITITTTAENTEREEGKGRYAKRFFGVEITCEVSCASCDAQFDGHSDKDEVQASGMEEC